MKALTEANAVCYGRGEEGTDHTQREESEEMHHRGEEAHTAKQGGRRGQGPSAYRTQKTPESQVAGLEFLLSTGNTDLVI